MAFEQRDNSGVLFKNDRRQNDRQPEYKGQGMINGREVWISAWVKDGKNGKFFSLAFDDKEKGRQEGAERARDFTGDRGGDFPDARHGDDDMGDAIPFIMEWRG